jgi:hypothetical protein
MVYSKRFKTLLKPGTILEILEIRTTEPVKNHFSGT